jgi:glycosyltransferase involved in cell wall biosynthesis
LLRQNAGVNQPNTTELVYAERRAVTAIDFLHMDRTYSGETLRAASMGGTESSVVQLAEALARRGHEVAVFNGMSSSSTEFGVQWWPISEAHKRGRGEIGIAVASPKAFKDLAFRTSIYWLHNPLKSWREIRRGSVLPLLRTKPHFVLLGEYHKRHVPGWLPSCGRQIIRHGIHEDFFRRDPAASAPPPRAVFTSQPYRGLDWLLSLWPNVRYKVPAAVFDVFAPKAHQALANKELAAPEGVAFLGSISRPDLVRALRGVRIQLIPGHSAETYCLAAAEAIAAGVPVVTLGIGALSERVSHGVTGFVARDRDDFVARTVQLLSDDQLWHRMHRACLEHAELKTWDTRAEEWEQLFARLSP